MLANDYGRFSDDGGEFVITNIMTPRPWANVLANPSYGLVLSQLGGGFSWYENCQLFRLSRWDQDLAADSQGRFLYIADLDHPECVWSTTYQPTRIAADLDEVRHGLGYTTYVRQYASVRSEQTVFVPRSDSCEVWLVRLTNLGTQPRRLRIASYLEWHLGTVGDWHREFHRLFMEASIEPWGLVAWKHPGLPEGVRDPIEEGPRAFVSWQGAGSVRWTTDKSQWLGRYGSVCMPEGLFAEQSNESTSRWDDPIAAGVVEVELAPGQTQVIAVTLGAAPDVHQCQALALKYTPQIAESELNEVKDYWKSRCGSLEVLTPDSALNLMVNSWLPYQTICGRMIARCAYYQQGGAYGYRDQLQDSLSLLSSEPDTTLTQIGLHAEAMFEDGGVKHWWHPGTPIGVPSQHSDTCLWLAYATLAYVDETNDIAALDKAFSYANRDGQGPERVDTLLAHMLTGIGRALSKRSRRGLPLIGAGDWNDGLSHAGIDGKGESVWLAMFLYDILVRINPILLELGLNDLASCYAQAAAELREAVNTHAWDGEWFIAGTRDDGKPLGSRTCEEGAIFLNPQTWSVISGITTPERQAQAMDSVRKHLLKPYGAQLLSPAYQKVDPYIGYITRYAPGLRENGGVYSHASTWAIRALAMLGDADGAYELLRGMMPPLRSQLDPDLYAAEPYVMPGNLDGPDSPYEGRAGWTWYTGSAAWMRRMAIEQILGVRATRAGLLIQPNMPTDWHGFSLVRPFRGDKFAIKVVGNGASYEIVSEQGTVGASCLVGPENGALIPVTVRVKPC